MKNLFSLILMVSVLFLASCSKSSDDPTPTVQTNLDKVKATLVGTWTFQTVTVTENSTGKSATTSTCAKTELKASGLFTNTKWQNITPLPNFTYKTGNKVDVILPCASTNSEETLTVTENSDKTINVSLTNGRTYLVNVADIEPSKIKARLVNGDGYNVLYQFSR
jgi:hypothetical protein